MEDSGVPPSGKNEEGGKGPDRHASATRSRGSEGAGDKMAEKKVDKMTKKEKVKKCCRGFWTYMYNTKEKTVMGRGCRKWTLLVVFIVMSYLTIAALFMGLLGVVMSLVHPTRPQYYLMKDSVFGSSRIQRSPGVIFVPEADRETNQDSPLIWISDKTKVHWGKKVGKYLAGHTKYQNKSCSAKDDCFLLKPSDFGNCSLNMYGWNKPRVQPSFIIRMTRMWGWKPEFFTSEDDLKKHFKDRWVKENHQLEDQGTELVEKWKETNGKAVIILCAGEKSTDAVLAGKISYCTQPYVEEKYFPFKNDKPYISPFIVIQFQEAIHGIPISIECFPIAKNIEISRVTSVMTGMDRFEFMID